MADQDTTIRLSFPVLYQELGMRNILATDGTCVLKVGYIAPVTDPVPNGPRVTAVLFTAPGARGRLPRGEVGGGTGESLDKLAEHLRQRLAERGPWWKTTSPEPERTCEMDGVIEDTYGAEHYWNCGRPGAITVDGKLLCEDHAGELGYGPKQEEYGFDPHDGHNPTPDLAAQLTEWIKAEGITGNYPPDQIAARIVAQCHASNIERWLATGHDYLRGMCRDIKDWDHMTLEERAAENYWHGHGNN